MRPLSSVPNTRRGSFAAGLLFDLPSSRASSVLNDEMHCNNTDSFARCGRCDRDHAGAFFQPKSSRKRALIFSRLVDPSVGTAARWSERRRGPQLRCVPIPRGVLCSRRHDELEGQKPRLRGLPSCRTMDNKPGCEPDQQRLLRLVVYDLLPIA